MIISYNLGNVIDGGDGDDYIGAVEPYTYGPTDPDATTYYVGGAGADTFHLSVSSYMPNIEIVDFDPTEGDRIEISPDPYNQFMGFAVVNGHIALQFEYGPNPQFDASTIGSAAWRDRG